MAKQQHINVRIIARPTDCRVIIRTQPKSRLARLTAAAALTLGLSACNAMDRLGRIGGTPDPSPISNPIAQKGYQPITTPQPEVNVADSISQPNSLWHAGSRAFFRDQRAAKVGDILTVKVNITDAADLQNETKITRTAGDTMGMPNVFGLEKTIAGKLLPSGFNPATALSTSTNMSHDGKGEVKRNEAITTNIAAMIIQKLPNGNLVINGSQDVLVDNEMRQMKVSGIIRPEDIASDNSIMHQQIADARITYGGKGESSDIQAPRYGQQLMDIISPF